MNKTYRIVWNETTNTWVAVAEIAKAHGKSASVGGGIVASCTQVGARFAFTAAASAVLMMGAPAMAANGTEYQANTDNICYYDTTTQSVICGDGTTSATNTGNPPKSVVMGAGATSDGETNVAIGSSSLAKMTGTVAIGGSAKALDNQAIAIGLQAEAAADWDISIGRQAGFGTITPAVEGRNIAIGDGALRNATAPNNNIAMGTNTGGRLSGSRNVLLGTYVGNHNAVQSAMVALAAMDGKKRPDGSFKTYDDLTDAEKATYATQLGVSTHTETDAKGKVTTTYYVKTNDTVALGHRALATKAADVAIGQQAKATGGTSVAVGNGSYASQGNAVAVGREAKAMGSNSIAQGTYAHAGASGAIALGIRANAVDATTTKTTGANSIAIGMDTNASTNHSVAIGTNAMVVSIAGQTPSTGSVALGASSKVTHVNSVAIGNISEATGQNTFAGGNDSHAIGKSAVAIGDGAGKGTSGVTGGSYASGDDSTAVGAYTKAAGEGSTALGLSADASALRAVAVGAASVASAESSIAIGDTATAKTNTGTIAIGKNSTASGASSVAVGTSTTSTEQSSVAVGNKANASEQNTVAIGDQANASNTGNIAIGQASGRKSTATGAGSIGANTVNIGVLAGADSWGNQGQVAVGWRAGQDTIGTFNVASGYQAGRYVEGHNNIALGKDAGRGTSADATGRLKASDTVAIGTETKATADNAIAIGNGAQANAINTISIGTGNVVSGEGSGAIGDPSTVSGTGSYSLGNDNTITTNDTFVIGNDVTQTLENSVILGDSSSASQINTGNYTLNGTQDANVAGKPVLANGVVSVGSAGKERQIQNVAAGVVSATSTDAINGSQLYAVAKELKDGQTHYYSVNSTKTATGDNYNNEGATGQNALAAGVTTSATGTDAVAIGSDAIASGEQSLAVGNNVQATNVGATAVGNNSRATADSAQAFGQSSQATAKDSVAMGRYARATAERATAVGVGNLASGVSSFAGGDKSTATGAQSVAIGLSANSADINTIAMGNSAQATKEGAIAIGTSTISGSTNSVVLGTNAKVQRDVSTSNVIIGHDAQAIASTTSTTDQGKDAVAIGYKSQVGAASNVALGSNAKAIGNSQATAVGHNTDALGYQSAAFGSGAKTSGNAGSSLALGKDASATIANGVALGSNSVTNIAAGQTGADPLSAATDKTTSTWTATHAAVSVGKGTDITRQITSVAAGTNDTDAVNVAQLKAAGFTLATSASAGVSEDKTVATATGADDKKIQNGETVTVDAGKNIKVTQTGQTVSIATKDDVAFTTVTTTDATGNQTVLNGTGITITPTDGSNPVSLTSAGLNNGGNKITNVADGNIASGSKEAVNGGQIFDLKQELTANSGNISKGLDFAGNTGEFNRQLGEKTTISGGLTSGSSSNTNIRTVATNGTIDIQLADAPVFTGKVSAQGLDAGGQKITNVAKGSDDADAVNVKQLQESLANITVTNQSLVQANSPFSYVNSAGEQLIRHVDGSGNITFTKASDGSTYANSDITISALNPKTSQTATPTIVGNIADGKANNDAVNVSQLKNAVTALGAGAAVNADGSITKPTYTVVNNTFDNVGGAIDALNTEVQKPLTFAGDSGVNVERKLGTTINVVGGVTDTTKLTDDNIGIVADGTDTLTVKLAKNIDLGVDGSVTTGDTKVDNAGVTIASTGKTPVSLTNAGLDNGGNVISNVGAGKANTDAVNVSQLTPLATALGVNVDPNSGIVAAPSFVVTKTDGSTYAGETTIQGALDNIGTEIQKGITFTGNSGQAVKKLGETFNIKGTLDSAATASDKNIRTEVDSSGVMSIKLAESPKFGNVTINDAGKITGVTAGTADTDAVNVAQLNAKTATTPLTVSNTGVVDTPADTSKLATAGDIANAINKAGFTLTTAKTTDGELGANSTNNELINAGDTVTVEADKNIKVTQTNGKISIATKDAVSFNSVTAGTGTNAVVLDDKGVNIGGKTYISDAGLNANDKKITNVANGDVTSTSKDAINGSQLRNTADDIASIIGGNAAVDNAGNVTASNIGGTTATTIDDAIKTVKTTVKSTDNTIKVTTNTANANDGTVFDISVDSQKLAESAQLPVVYTKADGTKVYKVGNSFFDNKDGTGTAIDATDVIASMQNADGTTSTATKLANIAKGEVSSTSKDAINGSQLFAQGEGVQNIIGGNTTYDPATGTYTNNNIGGTGKGNISDAIQTVNTKADANATEIAKGLNFGANDQTATAGDAIKRQLGETIGVKGGITNTSTATSGENVITRTDANGNINIELAKNAKFDSVTTGGTLVDNSGITIKAPTGGTTTDVKLTASGLNNGGNKITNVAAGTDATDAVNKGQLDKAQAAATTKVVEGKNVKVTEQPNADGSKTYTVATKDDVNFNNVTAGTGANQVVLGDDGVKVGGNTYISDAGLNANDKKITNVANGDISANSKDAINGSQLRNTADDIASIIGGNATVDNAGNVTASNIGGTGKGNINDAIQTVNTKADANATEIAKGLNFGANDQTATAGDAIKRQLGETIGVKGGITNTSTATSGENVITRTDANGNINIELAKNAKFDSVTTGGTLVDNSGITIKAPTGGTTTDVKLTASGLNNGGNKITNVAAGTDATDAVNKGQLDKAQAAATTKVVEGKNVKVTEQPNADGSKTYTVATKDDVNFNNVTAGSGANQVVLDNDGVKVGGNTYISDAGLNANNKKVSNVANGDVSATSKDAINGSQLFGTANSVATALGGGATVQADGTVSAPTYNITNPADGTVTKANNVGDALKGLNDAVNSPLIFAGDSGKNVERKLGATLGIKGGVTDAAKLSQNNIGVVSNGTDTLEIQLAKELTGLTSVSTGNTVMNNDGVTITGAGGAKPVSLTNAGLDNGGNKITNVAAGEKATDAVNKGQLDAAQAAATSKVEAGDNIEVVESENADGSTTYTVATAKDVNFNSVTAGSGANQVVLDTDGVKVGGNTYISNAGLNANDKKIINVANGDVSATSKDAINGSQLFAQGEGVKNIIGGNTTYDPATGTYTNNNIGGTGKGNINDAIQAINTAATQAKSTVTAGDNIVVTPSQNADGSTNYTVTTAKDLTVDSIKAGDTTINNAGVTVGDKVALTNTGLTAGDVKVSTDGINAGNKVITNVASGLNGKTLDQIKADPNAAERTNAASIGDLAEVQSNVTNITNNVTNITNNVLNGNTKDANGNTVTYVDDSGNLTDAGKVALTTYNVSGQTEFVHNSVISAIQQMNNEGIKYFHTNDGQTPVAENTNSQDSSASGKYASAVGYQTSSSGENATAVGSSLTVTTNSQTAGATVTEVTENGQIVLKQRTTASGARAVALGAGSQALGADSIAIGTGNVVSGKGSGAIGDPTVVTGDSAYSIGNNNTVSANNAYALGSNITANVADSVYLGDRTTTSGVHIANPANGSTYTYGGLNDANVAGVTGSTAPANNVVGVVAVGNNADEVRQIQGVAAGVVSPTSTDAINGSQLYDTHQAIGNVANYTVNMGNQLNQRIDGVEKRSNAGTAAAMAVAGLPQAYLPGKSMMAVSGSTYRGESGYAVGFSSISDNGNWIIKGSATGNSRGHYGATAGVGYQW